MLESRSGGGEQGPGCDGLETRKALVADARLPTLIR